VAVEQRAVEGLSGDTPAGCKLVLTHPHIRQGMLMLTPACCIILGGCVARLEKARLAVRERWNEPPGSAVLQAARARSTNGILLPPPGGPLAAGGQVAPPSRREMAIAAAWAFETGPPAMAGAGGPGSNGNHAAAVPGSAHQAAAVPAAHANHHVAGMSEADLFGDDDPLDCDPAVLAVVTNGVAPAPQAAQAAAAPAHVAVLPLPRTIHQPVHAQQHQHQGGLDALFPPPGVEPDLNFPMEDAIPPAVPAAKPTFVKASSMVGGRRISAEKEHSGPSLNGGAAQPPVAQRGMPSSASAPPSQASLLVSTHVGGTHQAPAAMVHSTPSSLEPGLAGPPFTYLAALLARSGHVSPAGLRSPVSHGDGGASHGFLVGTILGFVGTLTCFKHEGRDEYDMRVVVEDGSGAVEARVDGGLLARRLGVTPARDLKAAMERDPGVKQAVLKLTRTLQRGFGPIRIQVPLRTGHSPHPDALMPVVLALPDDEAHLDWSAASDPGVRSHVRLVGQQLLARLRQAAAGRDDAARF
jgi:hypothetical protein